MAPKIKNWIAQIAEREFSHLLTWLESDDYDGKGTRKDHYTYHQHLVTTNLTEAREIQIINFNPPRRHPFDVTVSDGKTQLRAAFEKEATRAFERFHGHKFCEKTLGGIFLITEYSFDYHPTERAPKHLILKVSKFHLIKGTAGAGTIGHPSGVETHKNLVPLLAQIDHALSGIQSQVSYQPEMSSPFRSQSGGFSEPNSPLVSSHATLAPFATQVPNQMQGRNSVLHAKVRPKDHKTETTASLLALITGYKRERSNESNDLVITSNTRIVQDHSLELSPVSVLQPVSDRKGVRTLSRIEARGNELQTQDSIVSQLSFPKDHAVYQRPGTSATIINDDKKENSQESLGNMKGSQKSPKQRYLIREDVPQVSLVGRVPDRDPFQGVSRVPRRYIQIPKDQQILLDRSDSWAQPTMISSQTSYANIPPNAVKDLSSFNDENLGQGSRTIETSEIHDASTAQSVSLEDEPQSHSDSSNEGDGEIEVRNKEFCDSNSGEGVAEPDFSEKPNRVTSTQTASLENETHSGTAEDDEFSIEMKTEFSETVEHAAEEAEARSDFGSVRSWSASPERNLISIKKVLGNSHSDVDEFFDIRDDPNGLTQYPSLHETTQPSIRSPINTGEPLSSFHLARPILRFSGPAREEEEEEDKWELAVPHAIDDQISDVEMTEVPQSSDQHPSTATQALPMVQVEQTPFPKPRNIGATKSNRGGKESITQPLKSLKRLHDAMSSDPIIPSTYDVSSQESQSNVDVAQPISSNGKPPIGNFREKSMRPNLQSNNEYEITPELGMQVVVEASQPDETMQKTSHPHSSNVSKISQTAIFGTDTSEAPDQVPACNPSEAPSIPLEDQPVDSARYSPMIPSQTLKLEKKTLQNTLEALIKRQKEDRPKVIFSQIERPSIDTKETIRALRHDCVMDDLSTADTECSPSSTGRSPSSAPRSSEQSASLYEKYKEAYPTYNGSPRDFVRVLVYVEYLSSINKLVHPFLWDDFIRAFSAEYESYVKRTQESGEEPVTYFVYYNRKVVPTFDKSIITEDTLEEYLAENPEEAMKARLLFRKPQSPATTRGHRQSTTSTTANSQEANSPLDNILDQFSGGAQILPPKGRYFETYSQINVIKGLNTTATSRDPSPKISSKTPRNLPWNSPPPARKHLDSGGRSSPLIPGRSISLSRGFEGSFPKAHLRRSLEPSIQGPLSKKTRYSTPTNIVAGSFASSQDTRSLATSSKSGVRRTASMPFVGDNKVERLPDEQQRTPKLTSLKTERRQFHAFAEKRGRRISSHGKTPKSDDVMNRFCTRPLRDGLRDQEELEIQNWQF